MTLLSSSPENDPSAPYDCPLVHGNRAILRQALDVLVDNALEHGADEVLIEHHAHSETLTISISDEGAGLTNSPPDDLHGLGLPLARRLVASMPGRLVIAGAAAHPRVDIVLQRAVPAAAAGAAPLPHRVTAIGPHRLAIALDDLPARRRGRAHLVARALRMGAGGAGGYVRGSG